MTRKVVPAVTSPNPLWQPTTLTVSVHYEDAEWADGRGDLRVRAVRQAWYQLTDEVRDAASELGVGSRSWRRCIKKLRRVTGDERWTLVANNFDVLEEINKSRSKSRVIDAGGTGTAMYVVRQRSFLTDSTITHYQVAVETARAEIRHLTSDFLLSSALR